MNRTDTILGGSPLLAPSNRGVIAPCDRVRGHAFVWPHPHRTPLSSVLPVTTASARHAHRARPVLRHLHRHPSCSVFRSLCPSRPLAPRRGVLPRSLPVRRSPVAPPVILHRPHTLHDRVSNVRTSPRTDFLA